MKLNENNSEWSFIVRNRQESVYAKNIQALLSYEYEEDWLDETVSSKTFELWNNFFLRLLTITWKKLLPMINSTVRNSLFSQQIFGCIYMINLKMKRWLLKKSKEVKRVNERISVKDFENASIILIPIIIGSYWLLVTISKVEHRIRVYDTSRDGRSHQRRIKAVILKFLKVLFLFQKVLSL
mgnify:CR=1 FL=1